MGDLSDQIETVETSRINNKGEVVEKSWQFIGDLLLSERTREAKFGPNPPQQESQIVLQVEQPQQVRLIEQQRVVQQPLIVQQQE